MAVPTKFMNTITRAGGVMYGGGGSQYIVETLSGVLYAFFIDITNSDPSYSKSVDLGGTWTSPIALKACTGTQISVWYDRWSGINADLIHVVYTDSNVDDTFYRNINTASSDTLSTEYTVFEGASTANGGAISISRMRGGNLVVVGCIDAGVEFYSKKSTNVGVNWSDIAAGYEATQDLCIVMPGWDADNQDAMMFYYDISATEISVKYYDDSANSWSETSIATSIVLPATTVSLGHISATVDITNSQNLLVFWTAIDTPNADLRCFKVTQSAQTETAANVVLNSTDDQGFCAISINGSIWTVYYNGKSDGSETFASFAKLYYKNSSDGGATWGTETLLNIGSFTNVINLFMRSPIAIKRNYLSLYINYSSELVIISDISIPRATYQLGI